MDEVLDKYLSLYGHSEIVICHDCKGKGFRWVDVGHHTSDYESELCRVCEGEGN